MKLKKCEPKDHCYHYADDPKCEHTIKRQIFVCCHCKQVRPDDED
jgi:hypothetical protein